MLGHHRDRSRILYVTTGRNVGQQQMVFAQSLQRFDIADVETHISSDGIDELHTHIGVITRIPLANVM